MTTFTSCFYLINRKTIFLPKLYSMFIGFQFPVCKYLSQLLWVQQCEALVLYTPLLNMSMKSLVYISHSYFGNVVVTNVPRQEKYPATISYLLDLFFILICRLGGNFEMIF